MPFISLNNLISFYAQPAGPIIRLQVPSPSNSADSPLVTKESFDAYVSHFIIPKQELASRTMTVNVHGLKIIGYPITLEDKGYRRNQFMFNVCFVCYPWSRTVRIFLAS